MRKAAIIILVYAGLGCLVVGILSSITLLIVLGVLSAIAGVVVMITMTPGAPSLPDHSAPSTTSGNSFSRVVGRTLFYRCPSCGVLLRKRSVEGFGNATGFTSCSECEASFPYSDVYEKGLYDIAAEVVGTCPYCAAVLRGPADDLLGKPCPSCEKPLPSTAA